MQSRLVVAVLGALGVGVSYLKFIEWFRAHGLAFVEPWREAMTASAFSAGLHWDLYFSLAIVVTIALADRRRLGVSWCAAVIAAGCTLGVCAGLAIYWVRVAPLAQPRIAA